MDRIKANYIKILIKIFSENKTFDFFTQLFLNYLK
jgi:hypothetical protein